MSIKKLLALGFFSQTFDPNSISGQVLAWDVTDAANRIVDGSNNLQQLTDISGNGNNMVPASSGVRPPYSSSGGGNNKPYVTVTSGKTLGILSPAGITTSPLSFYMVCKMPSATHANATYLFQVGNTAGANGILYETAINGFYRFYIGVTPFYSGVNYILKRNTWMLVKVEITDSDSILIKVNDEPFIPASGDAGTTPLTIFNRFLLNTMLNSQWSEARVFNRILSTTEDQSLKDYLINKYSLSVPPKEYIFLGDSHTLGTMSGTATLGPYVQRINALNTPLINDAASGSVVITGTYGQSVGRNLSEKHLSYNKAKYSNCYVIFQYGTNDAAVQSAEGGSVTRASRKAAYKSYIQTFLDAGFTPSKLIICTPPYSTGAYVAQPRLSEISTDVTDISTELGITLCDFYQAMITAGVNCGTVSGGDGIHGDNAIHTVLYDTLVPLL